MKEKIMQKYIVGNKDEFAVEYAFFDETRDTEISMYVDGENVLEFYRDGKTFTTRWSMDELILWLRQLIDNLSEDPFPFECEGLYAAQKDDNARDFDSDDDEVFESYYQTLYEWNVRHRWHVASAGAILADVYFQQIGDMVEISWNNNGAEDGIEFKSVCGGTYVPKEKFISVVDIFLKEYAKHWFAS